MQLKAQIYTVYINGALCIAALPVGSMSQVKHVKRSTEAHWIYRYTIYGTYTSVHT
jgi:hypothetical protein